MTTYLTTGEAGKRLGVSCNCVSNYCRRGELAFTRTAGGWKLIAEEEVDRFEKTFVEGITNNEMARIARVSRKTLRKFRPLCPGIVKTGNALIWTDPAVAALIELLWKRDREINQARAEAKLRRKQ